MLMPEYVVVAHHFLGWNSLQMVLQRSIVGGFELFFFLYIPMN